MSQEMVMSLAIIGGMVVLLFMGLQVAWAIGIAATAALWLLANQSIDQFGWSSWDATYSFSLTAIPLFVFMGSILSESGICEKLFATLERWLGRLPGGLAVSTLAACGVFAAMSGSSMASCATFGKIAFSPMDKRGYSPRLSLGSIAIGSGLAPLIPPSVLMIIYATWVGIPITNLFAAGLVPGVLLTVFFILTVIVMVKLNPSLAPASPRFTWMERLRSLREVVSFVILILGVLGAIFGGIMTPTEAAAMGAFLSIVLTLAYRRLTLAMIRAGLLDALKVTTMSMFIYATAITLTHALNMTGITTRVATSLVALNIGVVGTIAAVGILYLILGCLFDSWSMMFLTFPFVVPVLNSLGVDMIWFGVFYVVVAEFGLVTPPFGLSLFILRGVVPEHSIETIALGALPFIVPVLLMLVLLTAFPEIAMWFPGVLYR
ncbi:MAG: TRAP transporter large permease subunit [Chloroflexi bacterium]|nr:TRAP transporter large permease subunit [Chloroflexota bacterium]